MESPKIKHLCIHEWQVCDSRYEIEKGIMIIDFHCPLCDRTTKRTLNLKPKHTLFYSMSKPIKKI